ncbi:MAG: nuclease domain-containing protein [Ktedonobacteraceae bacterium]
MFDPKYKLEGGQAGMDDGNGLPKKEDIDKMHAYRDAIRDEAQRRVVQSAAILYPGSSQRYADGIEALQAYPGLELALEERLRDIFTAALQV